MQRKMQAEEYSRPCRGQDWQRLRCALLSFYTHPQFTVRCITHVLCLQGGQKSKLQTFVHIFAKY